MVYNGINQFIGHTRGKHDSANSIAVGALSGMFRPMMISGKGALSVMFRSMMISGQIVASVAGVWAVRVLYSTIISITTNTQLVGNTYYNNFP